MIYRITTQRSHNSNTSILEHSYTIMFLLRFSQAFTHHIASVCAQQFYRPRNCIPSSHHQIAARTAQVAHYNPFKHPETSMGIFIVHFCHHSQNRGHNFYLQKSYNTYFALFIDFSDHRYFMRLLFACDDVTSVILLQPTQCLYG